MEQRAVADRTITTMPRIEEYGAPQVESQVPLEVSSRPIEEAGQMGRALTHFGQEFDQVTDMRYKRMAQEEVANAQVDFANARADWTNKLNKQIQEGKVDSKQLMSDYQDSVDEMSDKYETSHGRNAFDRQAALTKGMLLRGAVNAQAHLAGIQQIQKHQTSLDSNSNAIESNPAEFLSVYRAHMDGIDAQVETGLPANTAEKLKTEDAKKLAVAAVRGWIQIDPDKASDLLTGKGTAENKGAFDDFFDANTKHILMGEINTQKRAQEVDASRADAAEKKAKEKAGEAWKIRNLSRLENNELSAKEVIQAARNGTLDYSAAKEQLSMIDRNAKEKARSNPQLLMDLHSRIFLAEADPRKISNIAQIDDYAAKGLISISDRTKLAKEVDSTPEGQARRSQKKVLLDYMKNQLVNDKALGASDPDGAQHYSNALEALNQKEEQYKAAGKPVTDLYNATSKDSFYSQVLQYKRSPRDVMRANMERMRAQSGAQSAVQNADRTKAVLPAVDANGTQLSPDEWMKRRKGEDPKRSTNSVENQTPAYTGKPASQGGELNFALESLGVTGPTADERRKKQEAEREKNRERMKGR